MDSTPLLIAKQLSGLYRELVERYPFSAVVGVDISDAGASGRADELAIVHCNSVGFDDKLALSSLVHSWSVVDSSGFHPDVGCPYPGRRTVSDEWACIHPHIRFNTDGQRVRFGLSLGPRWYLVREGPIDSAGHFVVESLVNVSPWYRPLKSNPA